LSIRSLAYISILALMTVSLVLYTNTIAHAQQEATSLTISDDNFILPENAAKVLTATLATTFDDNLIENENITWFLIGGGTLRPSISLPTNSDGQVFVVYTAPSYEDNVIVTAYFAGDNKYTQSSAIARGTITTPTPINPIEPSSPSTGFSSSDIVIIAIAIICVIIVPAIILGKI
jgi:hypothetical protein